MEAQGAGQPALPLETALRELRDAIELREAEHARRNRDRVLFSRGVTLFFLGIIFGLILLGRVFNLDIFKERLYEHMQADAPSVVRHLRDALTELAGMNRIEVNRSLPTFAGTLDAAVQAQSGQLRGVLPALMSEDPAGVTAEADRAFAKQLRARFGDALPDDAHALALARLVHARELQSPSGPHEARRALQDLGRALRGFDPAPPGAFQERDIADALSNSALEIIREKMLAGELGLAVGDPTKEQDQ